MADDDPFTAADAAPQHGTTDAGAGAGQTPIPALYADWRRASGGDDAAVERAVADNRHRVAALRDPFMPLARGDETARAKETVLWEDAGVMVIVDSFSPSPKALVIPKTELLFPVDAPGGVMDRLAEVSAATSDAYLSVGAGAPARCWINAPRVLTVRQLHVHVQPSLSDERNADINDRVIAFLETRLG